MTSHGNLLLNRVSIPGEQCSKCRATHLEVTHPENSGSFVCETRPDCPVADGNLNPVLSSQ